MPEVSRSLLSSRFHKLSSHLSIAHTKTRFTRVEGQSLSTFHANESKEPRARAVESKIIQHTAIHHSSQSLHPRSRNSSRACPNSTSPDHPHILLRGASSSRPTRRAPHPEGVRGAPCCLQPCSNLQLCSFAGISETSPRPWPSTWQYTRASMTREANSRRAVRPRTYEKREKPVTKN